ncbi:MAG: hypothetical protein ABFC30_07900 [Proteiniphilum sp.]|jgi:Na+-transporting methylmalonyl-CoA/oxaloacetate decarboxylase gamma subunit
MTTTVQTALLIAVIGIAAIFIFMSLFYLLIFALDKYLPYQEEKPAEGLFEEADNDGEEEK